MLAVGAIPGSVKQSLNGFLAGGQLGYNWQLNNWLVGLETDFQWTNAVNNNLVPSTPVAGFVPTATNYTRDFDKFGTLRGRLGFIPAAPWLIYATGGLAYGNRGIGNDFICTAWAPPAGTQIGTSHLSEKWKTGWTAGGGVEWMFAPHWSLKGEYLYIDLGSNSSTITYAYGPGGAPLVSNSSLTSSVRDTFHVGRLGINYHF